MDCCAHIQPETHQMKVHGHGESDKHAGHHTESFLQRFWIALALTVAIFAYPEKYASLVFGSVIFFFCGWVFLASAVRELRAKMPGMMTLIALAITTAYAWSVYSTFAGSGNTLWWELSTLIAVMLLGHFIEMKAVQGAQGALKELAKLLPDTAEVLRNGQPVKVALAELNVGDSVLVRPGSKIPADGKIIDGKSDLNESIITGESKPVSKGVGQEVVAGSTNGDGSLKVEVTKIGENTFLAGVMRLVADAQASKSQLQILSDRAAFYLTIVAIVAAIITFIAWIAVGASPAVAVTFVVAVLVIACPHALGLAVPLVASISTTMGARSGLLIRQRLALEAARNIDTVLFDKTGTLTEAKFKVVSVTSDETLALAAAIDTHSEHPIGKAIVEEAKKRMLKIENVSNFTRIPGRGARGVVNGSKIFVGTKGGNDIVVEKDGRSIGTIAIADAVRPESKEAVERLKTSGIRVAMITGDSEETAKQVAEELGLDEYFARILPEDKVRKVKELQARGRKVAMVGDGVNDAPALSQADLGIAIGAGTNVAIESAGIVLVKSDPRDVAKIIRLSKLTYGKMLQNLFWATGYNLIAMPVAAGALASRGIVIGPAIAAVFMSLSTVIVSVNAVLLRKQTL
ncbi:MAG: cadmium-translocating P-type ATPase [Patescibacteria group bacterium]|nr:cadmium-translocating P-type ATPase [Patescibacteria group bacterium]MDE1946076.1 cadmium-translocating P-type ATPase [Patescibacteria group bacterium]